MEEMEDNEIKKKLLKLTTKLTDKDLKEAVTYNSNETKRELLVAYFSELGLTDIYSAFRVMLDLAEANDKSIDEMYECAKKYTLGQIAYYGFDGVNLHIHKKDDNNE